MTPVLGSGSSTVVLPCHTELGIKWRVLPTLSFHPCFLLAATLRHFSLPGCCFKAADGTFCSLYLHSPILQLPFLVKD